MKRMKGCPLFLIEDTSIKYPPFLSHKSSHIWSSKCFPAKRHLLQGGSACHSHSQMQAEYRFCSLKCFATFQSPRPAEKRKKKSLALITVCATPCTNGMRHADSVPHEGTWGVTDVLISHRKSYKGRQKLRTPSIKPVFVWVSDCLLHHKTGCNNNNGGGSCIAELQEINISNNGCNQIVLLTKNLLWVCVLMCLI